MQRIFQQHVRGGDLVDDRKVRFLAPEFGEPADHDSLVLVFLAHGNRSSCLVVRASSKPLDDARAKDLRIAWARHTPLLAMELAAGCATRA
jgi:hypothetical protein